MPAIKRTLHTSVCWAWGGWCDKTLHTVCANGFCTSSVWTEVAYPLSMPPVESRSEIRCSGVLRHVSKLGSLQPIIWRSRAVRSVAKNGELCKVFWSFRNCQRFWAQHIDREWPGLKKYVFHNLRRKVKTTLSVSFGQCAPRRTFSRRRCPSMADGSCAGVIFVVVFVEKKVVSSKNKACSLAVVAEPSASSPRRAPRALSTGAIRKFSSGWQDVLHLSQLWSWRQKKSIPRGRAEPRWWLVQFPPWAFWVPKNICLWFLKNGFVASDRTRSCFGLRSNTFWFPQRQSQPPLRPRRKALCAEKRVRAKGPLWTSLCTGTVDKTQRAGGGRCATPSQM